MVTRRYLDFGDAQEYTGFGQTWLREKMNAGELPFIKIGSGRNSAVRFKIEDLDALMDRHYHSAEAG
jgi:predicted DNA-binding transcriptional regulator AlpA